MFLLHGTRPTMHWASTIAGFMHTDQRHTILKWCSKGLLKTILQTPKYMIPKVWLLEFVTSDFFNEISRKCGKHYAAIKEISASGKSR